MYGGAAFVHTIYLQLVRSSQVLSIAVTYNTFVCSRVTAGGIADGQSVPLDNLAVWCDPVHKV